MPTKHAPGFVCTECGWTSIKWAGRCGECQHWGTVVEADTPSAGSVAARMTASRMDAVRLARPITEISVDDAAHVPTGVDEFDRVLGGGLVGGAAVLLSGEPGVGKSTLLLDVAARAAHRGQRVLYISAEESLGQVRLRAQRTGALEPTLHLAAETDLGVVLGQIEALDPGLVVVDSVQTVLSPTSDGLAGGVSQVREVSATLTRVAKERGMPVIMVGHVTKDGSIAGPRALEHLVDVVCHFEGDRAGGLRFVRAIKNRFGPTDEVGCFEMSGDGIREVTDPSGLFRSQWGGVVPGTCVTIALEGRRAIPVEVQALVGAQSLGGNPRRVVSGVDASRLAMLIAVLERRVGLDFAGRDVYVSTVGGMRLVEPAADLAIALALASALRDSSVPDDVAAFGEISLAGEVRPVTASDRRRAEARRLGMHRTIDSDAGSIGVAIARALEQAQPLGPRAVSAL
ncbi:MAG: DNA repair protein RadA [Microbacterium sp.]|nr:DNA repair protein RadA [Microbacterium sp.]